jgi:hypothetical protein
MIQAIILTLAMLFTPTAQHAAANQSAFTLEPDYSTLWLDANGPRTFEPCNPWPIKPFQPRAFNLRGKIFNGSADEVGNYFVRGVIRQADGAHVADYALTLKGVGTIVFALDALPDVDAAEIDGFIFSGPQRNAPYNLTIKPRLTTDCTWGMRWELTIDFQPQGARQR